MIKRLIIMLAIVGIIFGLVFGFGAFRSVMIGKFLATLANPPQTVATITAATTEWQPSITAAASIVAINGANISSDVSGIIDKINFKSGDQVTAGTLLATLRPNSDDAVLAQLQATAKLDNANYQRDLKQFSADAVSAAQVDTDRATYAAAQAQVQAQQASMEEKQIKAPFTGTLGIREVNVGQYLSAGTQIVTLQQLNPLFVDFYIPQTQLAQIATGEVVSVSVDGFAAQKFAGTISAISSAADAATRTVQVRATIQNDQLLLKPGMFATVTINTGQPQNLITLPQTAITYNPYGDTVYVVTQGKDGNGKDALTAKEQFVQTGDTRGDQVAILKGVNAGDVVVTAGQLKLHQGSLVTINNDVQMSNDPNPMPANN